MSDLTEAVPVEKWAVQLEAVVDAEAACAAWIHLVRAQGWSPVGEPAVVDTSPPCVMGRLVKYPGLTVSADIRNAIALPTG